MSTIKGIFEPFASYVVEQLKIRRAIVANSLKGGETNQGPTDDDLLSDLQNSGLNVVGVEDQFASDLTDDQADPSVLMDQVNIVETTPPIANLLSRNKNFYTYVSEKQCIIRMASGVDVDERNNILKDGEEYQTGSNLAYNWILEGGIKAIGGNRGGISEGVSGGFAYGDMNLRADADDGFGIVPMPGIIDAEINTKSEDGSLREAKVNFVCFNRRQLEVLETLYMRPGYPIMLEWGWVPYIDNDLNVINNGFSILEEFFKKDSSFDRINFAIKDQKIKSGGNYDGFVGFCKNFYFKAREDGGYDCTTEIIAQGEILESFKTPSKVVPKLARVGDYEFNEENGMYFVRPETESVDKFLYFLRSIKQNLDQAGMEAVLKYMGTNKEFTTTPADGVNTVGTTPADHTLPLNPEVYYDLTGEDATKVKKAQNTQLQVDMGGGGNPPQLSGPGLGEGELDQETIEADWSMRWSGYSYATNFGMGGAFYYYKDDDGNVIPIHELNVVRTPYVLGMREIESLISKVIKVPQEELEEQRRAFKKAPAFAMGNREEGWFSNSMEREGDVRDKNTTSGATMRSVEGLGFETIYDGTILKEFSLEDESDSDSGIRKKIFVRWDLICQIFNREIIPKYNGEQTLAELTYLTKDTPTYKEGKGPDGKWEGSGFYIPYSRDTMNVIVPLDTIGLNDVVMNRFVTDNPELDEIDTSEWEESGTDLAYGGHAFFKKYGYDATISLKSGTISYPPLLGRSYDRNVCIMPHQLPQMTEMTTGDTENSLLEDQNKKNFTSFKNVTAEANSIGHVYFNLDYLITTYENISLEEYKSQNDLGKEVTKRRLKKKFSIHDFITTIWNGVNDACGGYYDFGLHTEHERPNVARIIDFTMSGSSKDTLQKVYEFNPQGLYSVTRDNFFQSKLDNDFASVVSIAAQSPNEINSIESVSFKAFHKGIKSRFTSDDKLPFKDDPEAIEASLKEYQMDYAAYEDTVRSLMLYINRMNQSNYESQMVTEGNESYLQRPVSVSTAKAMAARLDDMRVSILSRYPEVDENGIRYDENHPDGHFTGQYRDDLSSKGSTTFNRNAIIPLTSTITLDGISGINPLNIYKINSDKLPEAYKDPNIVFCVKKELHKITAGQDWTVDVEGYLTLLNDNPATGTNPTILLIDQEESELDVLDDSWEKWLAWVPTRPWSAVFISWVVHKGAGITAFDPFSAHVNEGGYFERNKDTDHFEHLNPQEMPVQIGDILVYSTGGTATYPGPYNGSSHADIVIDINYTNNGNDGEIHVVGGNVSDMVKLRTQALNVIFDQETNIIPKPMLVSQNGGDMDYYNGSMLRAKDHLDRYKIAQAARGEHLSWPVDESFESVKEIHPKAEEPIRKYWSVFPPDDLPK